MSQFILKTSGTFHTFVWRDFWTFVHAECLLNGRPFLRNLSPFKLRSVQELRHVFFFEHYTRWECSDQPGMTGIMSTKFFLYNNFRSVSWAIFIAQHSWTQRFFPQRILKYQGCSPFLNPVLFMSHNNFISASFLGFSTTVRVQIFR